jgi:hypothetical protein
MNDRRVAVEVMMDLLSFVCSQLIKIELCCKDLMEAFQDSGESIKSSEQKALLVIHHCLGDQDSSVKPRDPGMWICFWWKDNLGCLTSPHVLITHSLVVYETNNSYSNICYIFLIPLLSVIRK